MAGQPLLISYSSSNACNKITWRCGTNIALVKHFGKRERQLPSNPSLSMTLSNIGVETNIEYEFIEAIRFPGVHFSYEGVNNESFTKRVTSFIDNLILDIPILSRLRMTITSKNITPNTDGIIMPSNVFSSLSLCLCSIEEKLEGSVSGNKDFFQKASYLARLGSGGACRSVYGGYVIWGDSEEHPTFSNLYGQPFPFALHPTFQKMQDAVLVVSKSRGQISNHPFHAFIKSHPEAMNRFGQARKNFKLLLRALQFGEINVFIKVVEAEAMSISELLKTASDGDRILKPESTAIIEKIVAFREETGIPVCFTYDIGPNVHLLYPEAYKKDVGLFIQKNLLPHCEDGLVIYDTIGTEPILVNQ
jgi:diphosphomevalonate decarboxylase